VRLLPLLRSCHPLPAAGVTTISGLLVLGLGADPATAALATGTVGLSQLSVGWANDAIDARRDSAVGRDDKPLVVADEEQADRRTVMICALAATALTIAAGLAWGWPTGGWILLALASAQLYNWPLKATPASIVPYLVSFGALPAFLAGTAGRIAPGWLMLGAALLGGGAHLVNAVPDLADDTATGVHGLPQRLGRARSLALAGALLAAATVTLIIGARPPWWVSVGAIALAAALPFVMLLGSPRRAFQAVIAIAAVDVFLLVIADNL
jgi:heme o synthase